MRKKYFAKLYGDIVGIDHYIGFYADDIEEAQEFADNEAAENFSQYEDELFDEDGEPRYYATVFEWNDEKHSEYFGNVCFTGHFEEN